MSNPMHSNATQHGFTNNESEDITIVTHIVESEIKTKLNLGKAPSLARSMYQIYRK